MGIDRRPAALPWRREADQTHLTTVKLKETLPGTPTDQAMRIALLTDIHGNREALTACLDHAGRSRIDRFVFLGDYVGYGADPVFTLDTVMAHAERGAVALLGNHDAAVLAPDPRMSDAAAVAMAWTRAQLGDTHRDFIGGLRLSCEDGNRLYVHANARAPG